MHYVDSIVIPVPTKNLDAYFAMAHKCGAIWREHGALSYHECLADDVKPGTHTSFPQAVKLEEGETVVFAWITYASRAERDRINALVMADPRLAEFMQPENMPFDGKRMFFGGFTEMIQI